MTETRKVVRLTVEAVFEGNYIMPGEAGDHLEQWIDSGLEDRDDLRSWCCSGVTVTESPLEDDDE